MQVKLSAKERKFLECYAKHVRVTKASSEKMHTNSHHHGMRM